MTTLRLAGIRRRGDVIAVACVLGLVTALTLIATHAADSIGECWLAGAAVVAVLSVAVPHTFWLRADDGGLTLVRLLVPRRYAWSDVRGIAVDFGEDPDTDARHARLRLQLADPPGHRWGPLLAGLPVTDESRPRGGEPRELAELLALFGRRGLPVGPPAFADAVLAAHGLPPLPTPLPRHAPTGAVPTPERAYADTPEPEDEKRRLDMSKRLSPISTSPRHRREYLLRSAAAADRIALRNGDSGLEDVAAALLQAGNLADHDGVTTDDDPRGYVRQQYLAWRSARG